MRKLNEYGITLSELAEADIELLRGWRNAPEIAENMEFNEHITSVQQKIWFNNLSKKPNYYFIITHQNNKIGLIHLNEFDNQNQSAHAGLFIAEKKYTGTGVSLGASLMLLTFAYNQLKLKTVYAKVKQTNKAAINYNLGLGFVFSKRLNSQFDLYHLTPELFNNKFDALKILAEKLAEH
ncbi:MAG: GNAT family N-acetyltransferase [Bacteroidia bacterium]|nr:GNAT family N-acetyltransferase [Bacteroidia bacterium]MBP9689080.1 GNAT family N-acetyltransferase [Bacteroidia bacterium]